MSEASVTPWVDVVEAPSAEKPGDITDADFPVLPSDQTDKLHKTNELDETTELYSADKPNKTDTPDGTNNLVSQASASLAAKWQGAWGTKDIQAAIAKDREKRGQPTMAQPRTNTAASQSAAIMEDSMDMDDPENPYFNASTYFSTVINKYICPKLVCGKYYDTKLGIIRHLNSPAHGPKTYECPKCSRIFKSAEAMMYHAESAGARCLIRETEHYGAFVDQLTGGIVQAETNSQRDAVEYSVKKDVVKKVFW
ncbi:Zinc finger, C2H2 [Cordyceps fumosorosea ARSEF 2679]|uniref:Zinc finger, C2H2 n=1 Tax=Cordyceps fumosorosea (strain ARSEF 2679) TaxID=1081104 RepID=A0A167P7U2_CORFA|nr:Zinc finger, C2H2 [Cordyceps fumosorosea ARSEF 2679]OAA56379.1 Zinc finger, C2H2 [Cordyceps fumosorosea ARSEF 2679]